MAECSRLYYLARIADAAELFEDLSKQMKSLARSKKQLNHNEFMLLCRGMQINNNKLRNSVKMVNKTIKKLTNQKDSNKDDGFKLRLAKNYLLVIKREFYSYCKDNIDILKNIVREPISDQTFIIAIRVIADNYRYMASISKKTSRRNFCVQACEFYRMAIEESNKRLSPCHPSRLRVYLNYSLFLHRFANQKRLAIDLTRRIFIEAFEYIGAHNLYCDDVDGILSVFFDNYQVWTRQLRSSNTANATHNLGQTGIQVNKEQGQGDGIHNT